MSETPVFKPFDAFAVCPKCGHQNVRMMYCTWQHTSTSSEALKLWMPYAESWPEHMHRKCNRCDYEWAETVMATDAPA